MKRAIDLILLFLLAAAMLALSWRKWPDPIVDFGRELYVPWRITCGDVLYRDLAYFNGPLSPYFNSLLFRVSGVGMMRLVAVNCLIFAGIVALMHHLLLLAGDRFTAFLGGAVLVTMFGFLQLVEIGNYNYATPYSHELTHGMLLSLLAMTAALWNYRAPGVWKSAVVGALLGLLLLTKVESFVAGFGATAVVFGLSLRRGRSQALHCAAALGAAIIVVLIAIALLSIAMPIREAASSVLGSWRFVFDTEVTSLPFYRRVSGLDDPATNLFTMLLRSLGYGAIAVLVIMIARTARPGSQIIVGTIGAVIIVGGAWLGYRWIPWQTMFRGLPVAVLFTLVVTIRGRKRSALACALPDDPAFVARLGLCTLAMLAMLKVILNVTVQHYGFVLAMPAMMVLVLLLAHWLPQRAGSAAAARVMVFAAVAVVAFIHVRVAKTLYWDAKAIRVSNGAEYFYANRRGAAVGLVFEHLRRPDFQPAGTLACMPEGVMINYLSRSVNPTPYFTLMPLEMKLFGREKILAAYQGHPPDFVVIFPHDVEEWGVRGFKEDYGRPMWEWITANYDDITQQQDERFPIRVLHRRQSP